MQFISIIGSEWKKDLAIGFLVGIGFILLNMLSPTIAIGLPSLGLSVSDTARLIVIGLLAPVIEEIVFRGAFLGLFRMFIVSPIIYTIFPALVFSVYHLTAYGGSIASASGAFLGAMLFAIVATILVLWRGNLLVAIIPHSLFNIFLLSKLSVVFG